MTVLSIVLSITPFSSSWWTAVAAPFANHLWQSTLFAAVAGLLALALRKNHAQARYWLWLAASVKFVVPFSLLTSLGSHLGWSKAAAAQSGFSFVMETISRPFSPAQPAHAAANALALALRLLPALLATAWLCGCMAVLLSWWLRWRRITATLRRASPVKAGREFEALRRLERNAGMAEKIELKLSESTLEPGIVGIARPVMLMPDGISDRLTDAQLEAVITHELCHVRRRDNLAAAVHMLVEAAFWFHPLVWWIGARLVDERERACDEEVLRLGSEPQVYAEGILKVCEFYLESPLVCVAGITGSNLKKRIEEIMLHHIACKLGLGKKLLLATVAIFAVAMPVAAGLLHPTASQAQSQAAASAETVVFESVSIKPKGTAGPTDVVRTRIEEHNKTVDFTNCSLKQVIKFAYRLDNSQISGGPAWITSDLYDISTTTKDSISAEQFRLDLQKLLADRFKLATHRELRELPMYELVVGGGGSKLTEVQPKHSMFIVKPFGHVVASSAKMTELTEFLRWQAGRPVVDKTGLTGAYDFTLNWEHENPAKLPVDTAPLFKAVSEQLGLELHPQTAPIETLVVDHAEQITGDK